MAKFKVMLGGPCTGKTTRFNNKLNQMLESHGTPEEIVETYIDKDGKERTKAVGLYFSEPNLLMVGRYNLREQFVGLDVVQSSMTQDTLGEILTKHNDKNILTEGNSSFSAARRLPTYMHSLGFTEVHWVVIFHVVRSVCDERKTERMAKRGKTPNQKQLDNCWIDNNRCKPLNKRFLTEALTQDTLDVYDSEALIEL